MSAMQEEVAKPISPKRAAAELEVVLSKSLFLRTPEYSDIEGSYSLSESDISRDSAYEWTNPERRRLAPRSASNPRPRRQSPPASGMVRPRPTWVGRSKSLGSVTSNEPQQDVYELSKTVKSLMDDDSGTVESSVDNSGERFTLIANIDDMQKDTSLDSTARSVGSRKSKRSGRSRASRRSMRSRKRGDSLEREISLTILQTAAEGADSAHFLVSNTEVVKSPVKSTEEILGDLFVSQDVSLEPISVEEGDTEFRAFFAEDNQFDEQQSPATSEDAVFSTKPTEDSLFTFNPHGEEHSEKEDEDDEGPSYAKKYINPRPEAREVAAIISEAPSQDSLFAFSDVTDDTTRGKELLFPDDALREEFPIGSRWAPEDTLKKAEQQPTPVKSPRLMLRPRPERYDLSVNGPSTLQERYATQEQLRTSSTDQSNDRYKIEMESSVDVANSCSFVSASDGASEVQQALAIVVTSPATSTVEEGALNLEREDSFVNEDNIKKVKQEEIFLDKLVDIVHVARERPKDIKLSEFYNSESGETESTVTVEYPEDEQPANANAENQQSASVPRVKSLEKIGDDDHPDPELDDFLEEHGFGDSDGESQGEENGEWMAFDNSPFGVSRFADDRNDDASGSTAPLSQPEEGKKSSPESPTSITDFSTTESAREKAKDIWWSKGEPDDTDLLSI